MAQLVVHHLEDEIKSGLQQMAARQGWSMEKTVRLILRRAVSEGLAESHDHLGSRMAKRFSGKGLTQPLPEFHGQKIKPVEFDE